MCDDVKFQGPEDPEPISCRRKGLQGQALFELDINRIICYDFESFKEENPEIAEMFEC